MGIGIAVGVSVGFAAVAQTQEDDQVTTAPTATESTGSSNVPFVDCPDGLANASTVFDHIRPQEGSVQSPSEALDALMSWYELIPGADSSDDFELRDTDGAVVATLDVEGEPPTIIQFVELVPEYWAVGQILSCEYVQQAMTSDATGHGAFGPAT